MTEISADQRRRLEELDEQVAPGRQHDQQRLRQDDPPHPLGRRQVQRERRLVLPARHRLDGAADHFRSVGPEIHAHGKEAGGELLEGDPEQRQNEEDPEELHQQRGAAKDFDVDGRSAVDERIGGEPHHPHRKRDQDGDDGRQDRLLDRDECAIKKTHPM